MFLSSCLLATQRIAVDAYVVSPHSPDFNDTSFTVNHTCFEDAPEARTTELLDAGFASVLCSVVGAFPQSCCVHHEDFSLSECTIT
jgi:hypothetical protein